MKREGRKVRAWMVERDISVSDVARRAGIARSIVSETVHGRRNNRKALRALLAVGCPGRLLALPEDMRGKEAAWRVWRPADALLGWNFRPNMQPSPPSAS